MSVFQSKANNYGSKHAYYYGRLPGGCMSNNCSEMTADEALTPQRIKQFSPCDYESYSARGEGFRRRLSGAVLHALKLSNVWRVDCESRGEWGGVFPVHLRLTHHKSKHVTIDILSPGNESPFWHGLIWLTPDHTGFYFWNSEHLVDEVLRQVLQRIDEMVIAGYAPGDIASVLRRGGIN